ncbi:MAG TPA: hypothetical protein VIP51_16605 [Eoetvoesiella sp.]
MQSSSRRAFLMGRRSARSPWDSFCQRMRRTVAGSFYEFGVQDGIGQARLSPSHAADVRHAHRLCAEYGVVLAVDGVGHAHELDDQSVLFIQPGREMAGCQRLAEGSAKWFVQPGCLLGELEAAGLRYFSDLPSHVTVAAWLADRTLCDWDTGETFRSGVVHASVLLAGGEIASLGPFGEHNRQPLGSLPVQKLVPALFQLASHPDAQVCRQQQRWPARYRLDALFPRAGQTVNLAHCVLGHGGDLGWVEWVVLDEELLREPPASQEPSNPYQPSARHAPYFLSRAGQSDEGMTALAFELDARVKDLFDPSGVFPHPGQDL